MHLPLEDRLGMNLLAANQHQAEHNREHFEAWQVLALVPTGELVDQRRQQPVRQLAEQVRLQQRPGEQLAMVGVNKPSLHYYSRKVVLYAGRPPSGLLDLAEQCRPRPPALCWW